MHSSRRINTPLIIRLCCVDCVQRKGLSYTSGISTIYRSLVVTFSYSRLFRDSRRWLTESISNQIFLSKFTTGWNWYSVSFITFSVSSFYFGIYTYTNCTVVQPHARTTRIANVSPFFIGHYKRTYLVIFPLYVIIVSKYLSFWRFAKCYHQVSSGAFEEHK